MAQYDGSIRIGTGIDTKEFKAGSKEIESEARRMAKTVSSSLGDSAKIALQKQTDAFAKQNQQYAQQEQKVESLKNKLREMSEQKVETSAFKEIGKQIESDTAKLNRLEKTQEEFLETGGKTTSSAYKRREIQIEELRNSIKYAKAEQDDLLQSGGAYEAIDTSKVTQDLEAAETKLQQMYSALQTSADSLTQKTSAQAVEEERLAQIKENAVVGNQRIVETVERIKQLEQEIADLKAAGVTEGYQDYDSRVQDLERLKQEVRDYGNNADEVKSKYEKLGSIAKAAFEKIGGAVKKTGNAIKSMASLLKKAVSSISLFGKSTKASNNALQTGFKNILKYGLGIRSLYALVNKLRTAIKEGFSNMANEVEGFKTKVDSLKASMLTLKNSFAAAFRPLVEIAIPYIQRVIDALANLMNMIGQFAAAITGQKTYTKAVKQTTAAIEGQTKAQNKQLSSLDKLNNLTSNGGGGGAGGGAGNMFEEAPIESGVLGVFQKLKDLIESKDWEGLGAYIAEAVNKGLQKVYDIINWNNVGPKVTAFVDAFTRTFNSLVDHLDWDLLGRVIGAGINTIVNTLNLLIEGIDWKNLGTKISVGMRGLINEVDWGNLGNLLGSKFMIQWDIFTGFVDDMWRKNDFTGLTGWEELGISLGNAVNGLFEKINFGDIAHVLASGFNGAIQTLKNFTAMIEWDDIADNLSNGLNTMIHETDWAEAGAVLGDFVLELLGVFQDVANDTDWEAFGRGIGEFLENIPWGEILGTTFDIIWEVLSGLISGLFDTTGGKVVLGIGAGVLAIAAFFNPAGALIAAIAGAAALIIANWDDIMAGVDKLKEWVEEKWISIKEKITGTTTELKAHTSTDFETMGSIMREKMQTARKNTDEEWNGISGSVSDQMEYIKGNSRQALDSIGKHISDTWENVKSNTRNTMDETGREIMNTWNESQSNTTKAWSSMKNTVASSASSMSSTMSSRLSNMRGNINNFSANAKTTWSNTYDNMKTKNSTSWNDMSRVSNSGMHNMKNTISSGMNQTKSIWGNIWDTIFGKVNSVLGSIQGAISAAVNAISGMISSINSALDSLFSKASAASNISVSKGSSGGTGGKNSRMATPYTTEVFSALAETPIPGYANGQVIPVSMKKHLAILGDNTRETEIVSPLSTMKQANKEALLEVLSELGLFRNGNGSGDTVINIDGREVFRVTQNYAEDYFRRTGMSPYPI